MRKSMSELRQTKREEGLAEMQERVSDGSLRIRQMTDEERAEHALARDGRFAKPAPRRSASLQSQR